MASHAMEAGRPGRVARIGHVLLHELRAVLPPTIFFFLGFNLILFTKRLILADHSSERKVKGLLSRLQTLSKKDIEKLAKD